MATATRALGVAVTAQVNWKAKGHRVAPGDEVAQMDEFALRRRGQLATAIGTELVLLRCELTPEALTDAAA
jgi:hypothetical protein